MQEYLVDMSDDGELPFTLPPMAATAALPDFYQPHADYASPLLRWIHGKMCHDRDLMQKAIQAFVSFLKSYKEHQLKYIFPFKSLDLTALAQSHFLLRMPRCPELKGIAVSYPCFVSHHAHMDSIPYQDKQREAARLRQKESDVVKMDPNKRKRSAASAAAAATTSWSDKKDQQAKRKERKDKKEAKRSAIAKAKLQEAIASSDEDNGGGGEQRDDEQDNDDWEDLQKEARLAKKLKRGKITQGDFDRELGVVGAGDGGDDSDMSE